MNPRLQYKRTVWASTAQLQACFHDPSQLPRGVVVSACVAVCVSPYKMLCWLVSTERDLDS